MTRTGYLSLAGAVILGGLALRLLPWGLPLAVHHYGGGILWGAMLFLLVSALRPASWRGGACLAATAMLACMVEATRLVHAPWLDAFRLTLAGQLLLGRIFSAWNLLAYAIGIATAAGLVGTAFFTRRRHRRGHLGTA